MMKNNLQLVDRNGNATQQPKKKIYIAGKVTGEDLAVCTMKFGTVQRSIEALGFEVINPMELIQNKNTHWQVAMRICIMKLMTCHGIFVLRDHIDSRGATIEFQLAKDLDMPHFRNINELKKAKWNKPVPTP
ncbi:MAG: DUF4406 domain-containing protein [Christiangramia sp.]|uniref:DUF4406 domain-containing protein n=1 Tax=Christiangramia sp. TaxID=1931228 RepID=UPI0032422726